MTDTSTAAAAATPSPLHKLLTDLLAGFNGFKNNLELLAQGQALHPTNTDAIGQAIVGLQQHLESDDARFDADEAKEGGLESRVTALEGRMDSYDAEFADADEDLGDDAPADQASAAAPAGGGDAPGDPAPPAADEPAA